MLKAIVPKGVIFDLPKLEAALAAELNAFAADAMNVLGTYPVQRPAKKGKTYRRTGTLGRSWSVDLAKREGSILVTRIGSQGQVAPYNIWVQAAKSQARKMKGRGWATDSDAIKKFWPATATRIVAAIRNASKSHA